MDRRIRLTADAAVELDARLCQRHLCAAADTAADQGVHAALRQKARQCTVAAAVGVTTASRTTLPSSTS